MAIADGSTGDNASVDPVRPLEMSGQDHSCLSFCFQTIPAESPEAGPSPRPPGRYRTPSFSIGTLVAFLEMGKPSSSRGGLKSLRKGSPQKMAAEKSGPWGGFSWIGLTQPSPIQFHAASTSDASKYCTFALVKGLHNVAIHFYHLRSPTIAMRSISL